MDDTAVFRVLAFVHPAWMVSTLVMAIVTARLGIEIRRRRRNGRRVGGELRARHLRFGKRTLVMVGIGTQATLAPSIAIYVLARPDLIGL